MVTQAGLAENGVTTNGHHKDSTQDLSPDAQQVHDYTLKTLDLVVRWMDQGWREKESPACRWEGSAHLAKARLAGMKGKGKEAIVPSPSSEPITEEQLFSVLGQTLHDSVNPWTRRFLDKLYAAPTTLSPALELLSASLNASTAVTSAAPALCLAEEQTVEQFATLLKWDPSIADGLTMPGGSSSNVLAVQTALGNAFPSFKQEGILGVVSDLTTLYRRKGRAARPLLLTSEQSHYSLEKSALACGMGLGSVVKVKCDPQGKMHLADLERILEETLSNTEGTSPEGGVAGLPFFINATSGTTILGAFDDIEGINNLVQKYGSSQGCPIWVHADGSWGGPVIFSSQSSHLMKGVSRVDSVTINPHKILNVTQQCSFALFREGAKLGVNVTGAKYLFHGAKSGKPTREYLRNNPASKTMGCARRADAFKFYIEWLRAGTSGFEEHIERGISYAQQIVSLIKSDYPSTLEVSVATPEPAFLQVCFRPTYSSSLEKDMLPSFSALGETPNQSSMRILSTCTHFVHAKLRSLGKYQVDKAPVHYPTDTGYFMRLVTHPSTPFDILRDLVREIDRIGQEYFAQLQSDLAALGDDQEKRTTFIQQLLQSDE